MARIWRILSIDGGGVRGIIPISILATIEQRTKRPIAELFDLIAGTSTGGILALGLTKPDKFGKPEASAQTLCELYKHEIPQIFRNPHTWWGNLLSPKYDASVIQEILKQGFGDCRLKSALTDILIPCYDIEHRSPHIFKSRWARRQSQYDFLMRDVAFATSATPTLFSPARIARPGAGGSLALVDGGIFANNPAMHAYTEVHEMFPGKDDKFLLLSLGTGEFTRQLTNDLVDLWGYVQWSRPMLELVSESISESVHAQMRYLLPPTDYQRYYRFQIDLPAHIDSAVDNASRRNLEGLFHAGQRIFDDPQTRQELDSFCETLLRLTEEKTKLAEEENSNGGYQVAVCYAVQDLDVVVNPLAEALRNRGIKPVVEKFGLQPEVSIRRRISQATETAMFSVVILSPAFLENSWAAKQVEWLYERTLSGKTVILPVIHGFGKEDIHSFVKELRWRMTPSKYLEYLLEVSEGATTEGIASLGDKLAERIKRWHE
jgi:predicted acylesterase/phospholipase RssA